MARVIVIDNAATVGVELLPPIPEAQLVVCHNRSNAGFARACNQGARLGDAEFVLFLNPDAQLEPGALAKAVSVMRNERDTKIGAVGLRLKDLDGVTQQTCGRFPTLSTAAGQTLGVSRLLPGTGLGFRMTEWPHDTTRPVDYVCGAALLVRRAMFEELGGFDERLFVYLEDADLCLRAARRGWSTVFNAEAVASHACGWSTGTERAWRLAQSWRSQIVYGWKHLGITRAFALSLLIFTLAPAARVLDAALRTRLSDAIDALRAWHLLWRFLWSHTESFESTSLSLPLAVDAESPRGA